MSLSNSYFVKKIRNPLFMMMGEAAPDLLPKIHHDENELSSQNSTTIYELLYYDPREHKSIPYNGWIKPCVRCHSNTSRTIVYAHPKPAHYQYFRIYICTPCKTFYKDSLLDKCTVYVANHIKQYRFFVPLS